MRYKSCVLPHGTQLGKVERRLLLLAKPHDHPDGTPLLALRESGGAAQRRSVASLKAKGLIQEGDGSRRLTADDAPVLVASSGRKFLKVRFIRRTALGDQVVAAYERELRSGGRIRWRS